MKANKNSNVGWARPEAVAHQGNAEWSVLPIEQVADVNPRIDKSSIPDDLPVSFVPMPAIGAGDGSIQVDVTRPAGEVKKGFTAFLEGDVLFAKITPCMENGKMAVVPKLVNGFGFGSTEFHVLRPKPGIDAKYLYYYVSSQTFRSEAERHMTGAVGQRRVPTTYLKECKIPVAPLDQQYRVVAEIEKQFSRLDEAVANLKRVKANLKRYKTAVLKAAVEGRLVETEAELAHREGRSYETGEQLLQRILETRRSQWKGKGKYKEPAAPDTADLPELPEGWVWATVFQVSDVASGNTPAGILDTVAQAGDVPWFKVGDMNHEANQRVMRHSDAWLGRNEVKKLGLRVFSANTVLFPKRGGAIATNKKRRLESPGCADLNIMGITPDETIALYFFAWFDGINLANHKDIEPLVMPLPPQVEQHRIVAEVDCRLSLLRETDSQVDVNLQRAERMRSAILAESFSGDL